MLLGELLKNARIAKGMTQKQVAEAVGIQVNHYQHYEYSKRVPSGKIMIKLVKTLDLDLNDVEKALESSKNA
jgi:transcriptional regulator with XRE-family HTH domain